MRNIESLEKKIKNAELKVNFQCQEMSKEDSSEDLVRERNSSEISVLLADCNGVIHAFNKASPKMFHVSPELLKGKNFFKLMSAYSRRF